jgi:hypothetical protein
MQDVQKVPSAKADGNILSQKIKKTVNLFHNNSYACLGLSGLDALWRQYTLSTSVVLYMQQFIRLRTILKIGHITVEGTAIGRM